MIAIEAPFVHVVRHVEKPISVRRRGRHVVGALERTAKTRMPAAREIVPPREPKAIETSARRLFPFGFGGESYVETGFLRKPPTIGDCFQPIHTDDRLPVSREGRVVPPRWRLDAGSIQIEPVLGSSNWGGRHLEGGDENAVDRLFISSQPL